MTYTKNMYNIIRLLKLKHSDIKITRIKIMQFIMYENQFEIFKRINVHIKTSRIGGMCIFLGKDAFVKQVNVHVNHLYSLDLINVYVAPVFLLMRWDLKQTNKNNVQGQPIREEEIVKCVVLAVGGGRKGDSILREQ